MEQDSESRKLAAEDFFLPDLCAPQTLLPLIMVAELLVLVMVLAGSGLQHFDWVRLGNYSLFVQWLLLASAGLLCRLRPWLQQRTTIAGMAVCYVLVMSLTLLSSLLVQWFLGVRFGSSWHISFVLENLIICGVVTGIVLRYFYIQQQLNVQRQAGLQARIEALQARIRPHFLFNSMNIIASLIGSDPDKAETVVEDLADLFRASLQAKDVEVPFADELELARKYAGIEQLRMGKRLSLEWDVDAIPASQPIPSLVLQPLLENAIYHGIQPLPDGGVVRISGSLSGERCDIRITNPLPACGTETRSLREGNKIAVENIRHRLAGLYGPDATLELGNEQGEFVAHLSYSASGRAH